MGVSGFVLAGGQSRRMGRDKADLPWGNRTLLEHGVDLLSSACDPVTVVGRSELPDRVAGKGPLGGILTGLEVAETPWSLMMGVDLPLMTADFLRFLVHRALTSSHPLVACRVQEQYPLCLAINRELLPMVTARVKEQKLAIYEFIDAAEPDVVNETEIAALGFPLSIFSNINTPEDWRKLGEPSMGGFVN